MGLESYTHCPSCESSIALKKTRRGVFACPHCGAEFRHNFKRWAVAVPAALVITLLLFYLASDLGFWVIAGGVFVGSMLASRTPEFILLRTGHTTEPQKETPEQRHSAFFKVAMTIFFLIVMLTLGWSILHLCKFLLR